MRRQTVVLLGLSVVLVVALYFLFSLFLENTTIPYAYEIAAAFMGALVTVVITMVLLNRQSEVETLKERNVELLKQKIAVYAGLMDRLEAIMLKGEVSLEDEIAVQMLNLRLSLFASTDVLTKFNEFARQFSLVAADRKVTGKERAELMDVLGQLSTTIRHDLASQEDRRLEKRRFSEEDLKNLVMSNVNMLFGNTAPKRLLESFSTETRGLLSRLTRRRRAADTPPDR
jgi:hypothetical protein